MFKYIEGYIDLPYLRKQGSYFSVNLHFVYNLLSSYSREINIYDNSLENAVDFYCVDQKKNQSPTHHYINFMKSVNKIIVKNNLISDKQIVSPPMFLYW